MQNPRRGFLLQHLVVFGGVSLLLRHIFFPNRLDLGYIFIRGRKVSAARGAYRLRPKRVGAIARSCVLDHWQRGRI